MHLFRLSHAGKLEIEGSEFYVTGTDGYSVYLVDKLSSQSILLPFFLGWVHALRKSLRSKAFIDIHYWFLCIDDNLVQQPIKGISDIANKKNTKLSCNKRLLF